MIDATDIAAAFDTYEELARSEGDHNAVFDALTASIGLHDAADEVFGSRCSEFFPPEGNPEYANRYFPEAERAFARPAHLCLLIGLLSHRHAAREDESPLLDPDALHAALDWYRDFSESDEPDLESAGLTKAAQEEFGHRVQPFLLADGTSLAVAVMGLVVALRARLREARAYA